MWDIWRFIIPSRIWSHWSYYLFSYCMVGRHNKEVSLLKFHGHGEISFSHLWHWSYLLMFFQQGRLCEYWIEDITNKSQRHIKKLCYFCIWDCRIFCQEWKWRLWFQMQKIWQQPLWNATKISTNGVLIAMTVIGHGYITGMLNTGIGGKSKPRTSQFISLILPPIQ